MGTNEYEDKIDKALDTMSKDFEREFNAPGSEIGRRTSQGNTSGVAGSQLGGSQLGSKERVPRTGYEHLARILYLAIEQSSTGKGHERHADSPVGIRPWHDQPILVNARQVGPGGLAQQVMKKAGESTGMAQRHQYDAAKAEALGAIVYAAALYKLYEEMEQVSPGA